MIGTRLVLPLLLAATTLSAAAHRPTSRKHRTATGHHPATAHKRHSAASHHPAKASKKRSAASKKSIAGAHHQRLAKRHSTTSQPHAAAHHLAKPAVAAAHRPAGHHHKHQPAGRTYTVTATVYQAVAGQTDATPFVTADNSRIKPRYSSKTHWLALSPDLLAQGGGKFQYGDRVQVGGVSSQLDGVYTVHDTMNRRYRRHIDILTHRREKLHVHTPDAKLQLAQAPRKSRAQATAAAHARLGRGNHARAVSFRSRASGKRANYLASAIL